MVTASDDETMQIWGVEGLKVETVVDEENVTIINAPLPGDLESDSE